MCACVRERESELERLLIFFLWLIACLPAWCFARLLCFGTQWYFRYSDNNFRHFVEMKRFESPLLVYLTRKTQLRMARHTSKHTHSMENERPIKWYTQSQRVCAGARAGERESHKEWKWAEHHQKEHIRSRQKVWIKGLQTECRKRRRARERSKRG